MSKCTKKKIKIKGIIYKITNTVNKKIYIGKTKTHYGSRPFSAERRLQNHITKALNGKNDCPALYNAIRKHGEENFVIEEVLRCPLNDTDDHEIGQIEICDSTNKEIGYNIAVGGGGRSVVNVSEEIRKKISRNAKDMNIEKIFRKGIHVGYTARRRDKGKQYQKYFSSTKNTLVENKKLAISWLKNFRNHGIIGETNYNKRTGLPKHICELKEKGKHVGYVVRFIKNGKTTRKSFQNNTIPLEKLLKKAIKFKDNYLNKVKIDE